MFPKQCSDRVLARQPGVIASSFSKCDLDFACEKSSTLCRKFCSKNNVLTKSGRDVVKVWSRFCVRKIFCAGPKVLFPKQRSDPALARRPAPKINGRVTEDRLDDRSGPCETPKTRFGDQLEASRSASGVPRSALRLPRMLPSLSRSRFGPSHCRIARSCR